MFKYGSLKVLSHIGVALIIKKLVVLKVAYSKVQLVWRAITKLRDFIIAFKIGKSQIFGFSHFEGKYQYYCVRLAYNSKAETVVFASKG